MAADGDDARADDQHAGVLVDFALQGAGAHDGNSEGALWAGMCVHRIANEELADFGASSKLNAELPFLCLLRDLGRRSAEAFLKAHVTDLGRRSSYDVDALLVGV